MFDDGTIIKQVSDLQSGEIKLSCLDCGYFKTTILHPTGNYNFNIEQADESKVFKKISSATSVYYKTYSDCGAFGNEEYVFEKTNLLDDYLEIKHMESIGRE